MKDAPTELPVNPRSALARVKLRHLNVLLAVAEHGSLVRAAQALSVTQPAVSKALAELEDITGQHLLTRTRKGVEFSSAGRVLVRYAGSSVRTLREGLDAIAQARAAEAPVLMVGALPNVAATILPPAVRRFLNDEPAARIRVRTGSNAHLVGLLRQGELDMVVGRMAESADMQGLSFEYLYAEVVVFAVRPHHPLLKQPTLGASRRPPSVAVLRQYRMVLPDAGTRLREAADQYLLASGLGHPARVVETIDVSFGRRFVLDTDAIWCVPTGVVENDLATGRLVALPLNTQASQGPVGLSLRSDRLPSEALQRLLDEIRSEARLRVRQAQASAE